MACPNYKDEGYQRWLRLTKALLVVKDAISPFIMRTVNRLHDALLKSVIPLAPCYTCRSDKKTRGFSAACPTHEAILYGIQTRHTCPNTIRLSNTNPAQWWNNSWEIAKLFCGRGVNTQSIGETDTANVLMIMSHCKNFHLLVANVNNVEEVIRVRNITMHSGTFSVDDSTLKVHIDTMIALLHDAGFATDPDIKSRIPILEHIRDNPIYITEEERVVLFADLLVETSNNLGQLDSDVQSKACQVDVDLHQMKVEAEEGKRRLKEIDVTVGFIHSNQTKLSRVPQEVKDLSAKLENELLSARQNLLQLDARIVTLESNQKSPQNVFDGEQQRSPKLQVDLQKRLRDLYARTCRLVSPIEWIPGQQLLLDSVYTSLRIRTAESKRCILGQWMDMQDPESIHHVFQVIPLMSAGKEVHSFTPKRILVEGEAGIGKTTSSMKLALDWAMGQGIVDGRNIHGFDLVFYLKARDISAEEDIFDAIGRLLLKLWTGKELLRKMILEAEERCLIILDGFDEIANRKQWLESMITREMLPDTTLLVMSRPSHLNSYFQHFDLILDMIGFTKEKYASFVRQMFKKNSESLQNRNSEDMVRRLTEDQRIADLTYSPLYATILCLLSLQYHDALPSSKNELYVQIEEFVIKKAITRRNSSKQDIESAAWKMRMVCFCLLREDRYCLSTRELVQCHKFTDAEVEAFGQLGFFVKELKVVNWNTETFYQVSHKSFMEALSAKHILCSREEVRQRILDGVVEDKLFEQCLLFFAGQSSRADLRAFVQLVEVWARHYSPSAKTYRCTEDYQTWLEIRSHYTWSCKTNHCYMHRIFLWLSEVDARSLSSYRKESIRIRRVMADTLGVLYFNVRQCTNVCFRGATTFVQILNYTQDYGSFGSMDLYMCGYVEECDSLLLTLPNAKWLRRVSLCGFWWSAVYRVLTMLKIGQVTSAVRQVTVDAAHSFRGNADASPDNLWYYHLSQSSEESVEFGPCLQSLWICGIEYERPEHMYHVPTADHVTRIIAGIQQASSITQLILMESYITADCRQLVHSRLSTWPNLEDFAFVNNHWPVRANCNDLLSQIQLLPRIQEVSLAQVSTESMGGLGELCKNARLRTLHLKNVMIEREFVERVMPELAHTLCILKLCSSTLTPDTVSGFVRGLSKLTSLQVLNMSSTRIPEGCYELLGPVVAKLPSLKELWLVVPSYDALECITSEFTASMALQRLTLGPDRGWKTDKEISIRAECLIGISRLRKLRFLHLLRFNLQMESGQCALTSSMTKCPALEVIHMEGCRMSDWHLSDIAKALRTRHTIKHLEIYGWDRCHSRAVFNAEEVNSAFCDVLQYGRRTQRMSALKIEMHNSVKGEKESATLTLNQVASYVEAPTYL